MGITRREFIKPAAASTVLTVIGLPGIAFGGQKNGVGSNIGHLILDAIYKRSCGLAG